MQILWLTVVGGAENLLVLKLTWPGGASDRQRRLDKGLIEPTTFILGFGEEYPGLVVRAVDGTFENPIGGTR